MNGSWARKASAERVAGFALIGGLHVALIAALMSVKEVREAVVNTKPLMVSLITLAPKPVPAPPPPPVVEPPKPKPLPRMIATPKPAPSPIEAAPIEPEPVEAPPAEPEPAASAEAAAEAPVESPITPPNYVAAYLNNPGPEYSYAAKQAREQGRVLLRVLVNERGAADEIQVQQSSGFARLDDAAVKVVRERWRFVPAKQGDTPVAAWVIVPISFKLKN